MTGSRLSKTGSLVLESSHVSNDAHSSYTVNAMQPLAGNRFKWPDAPDVTVHPEESVLYDIDAPAPITVMATLSLKTDE